MPWETLLITPTATIRRHGRFLVADLTGPHAVLSTSVRNGGQTLHVRHLVNHQSCEGSGHAARAQLITEHGQEAYHDVVCAEIGLPPHETAVMGTAANMHYATIVSEQDEDVHVTAIVTAGVQSNATCAGDPAAWRETREGVLKVPLVAGTINTMLLVDTPLTAPAMARTVITMTEGKSAALQRLAVPSCYSADLATGTGTDQFCIAAPALSEVEGPTDGRVPLTSASPHMKLGEIIGLAVRKATGEALRWQNGLEPSYTRGAFHALGRYGLKEATVFDDLAGRLPPADLELLKKNSKAVFYEPLVGAAAHALAAVLDRIRHGTLPASVAREATIQQSATLAASLAAQPERWLEFRNRLHASGGHVARDLVLDAIALGWSEKWRAR
jgi:adenosylcobinamide amidohydrolase